MGENADLLVRAYELWNSDDCAAWVELLDPDVTIHTSGVFPGMRPVYRGRDGAERFWHELRGPFRDFHIEVERVEDGVDYATAAIRFRATGGDSGVAVDMRFCNAIKMRDGLATALINRRTYEEVCDAIVPGAADADAAEPADAPPERDLSERPS